MVLPKSGCSGRFLDRFSFWYAANVYGCWPQPGGTLQSRLGRHEGPAPTLVGFRAERFIDSGIKLRLTVSAAASITS